jgi:rare lipoprotein A
MKTISLILGMILIVSVSYADYPTQGTASYYTYKSCVREGTSGVWTASGERFNENDLTCALRSRKFGKYYKVTNLANNKSVIVRHNDFGPNKSLYQKGRIIDLSKRAFESIADLKQGVIKIKIEKIGT